MTLATRLQKTIALFAACLVVVCNLVALRHQATVSHAHTRSGLAVHAPASACHDGADQTHAHQLPAQHDRDLDACELDAALHSPAVTASAPLLQIGTSAISARQSINAARTITVHTALLHVAPKTSPPTNA